MKIIDADVSIEKIKSLPIELDAETIQRCIEVLSNMPPAQPERKISNKEWIDFLVFQFDISRTSAKEMLHGMMRWKKEDNFKKQFNGGKNNGKTT